jgi:hypothetical protein
MTLSFKVIIHIQMSSLICHRSSSLYAFVRSWLNCLTDYSSIAIGLIYSTDYRSLCSVLQVCQYLWSMASTDWHKIMKKFDLHTLKSRSIKTYLSLACDIWVLVLQKIVDKLCYMTVTIVSVHIFDKPTNNFFSLLVHFNLPSQFGKKIFIAKSGWWRIFRRKW